MTRVTWNFSGIDMFDFIYSQWKKGRNERISEVAEEGFKFIYFYNYDLPLYFCSDSIFSENACFEIKNVFSLPAGLFPCTLSDKDLWIAFGPKQAKTLLSFKLFFSDGNGELRAFIKYM